MPEPDERKPAVIPIEEGETVYINFVSRGKRAGLFVKCTTYPTDCTALAIWESPFNRRIGETWFKPDPVRAAELAERKRCKAKLSEAKAKAQRESDYPLMASLRDVMDAIDAPEPEPSEYERGVRDSIQTLERLQPGVQADDHARRAAYTYAARLLRESLLHPEPTP